MKKIKIKDLPGNQDLDSFFLDEVLKQVKERKKQKKEKKDLNKEKSY